MAIDLLTGLSDGVLPSNEKPRQQFPTAESVNPYEASSNLNSSPSHSVRGWPTVAKILTFYCLVFAPLYVAGNILLIWFHFIPDIRDTLFQHAEYFYQVIMLAFGISLVFLYPVAGIKLMQKDRSAILYTIIALGTDVLAGLLNIFVLAFSTLILIKLQQYSSNPTQSVESSSFTFFDVLALCNWVLSAFAVVALVWFVKNFRKLAWRPTVNFTEEGQR